MVVTMTLKQQDYGGVHLRHVQDHPEREQLRSSLEGAQQQQQTGSTMKTKRPW